MSDSFEDYPPARAFDDQMTTDQINEAIAIKYIADGVSVAVLQADVAYWREAARHMLQVKGSCGCQGRAEKLWCRRCRIMDRYEQETGIKCR